MRLFQTFLSPFPVRVRLAIHAKGLEVEFVEPPGFGSDGEPKGDYLKINPMGRVPTLVLDDGRALPESEVICEYLDDAYPAPPLRPSDPWARARVRLLSRLCDVYVIMAMVPLFYTLGKPRDAGHRATVDAALRKLSESLGFVEEYIGDEGYAVGRALTLADGSVPPMLLLACEWAHPLFGGPDPLLKRPKLAAYWKAIQSDPFAGRALGEMRGALTEHVMRRAGAS